MSEGTIIQEAFVSGELSPAMWGRVTHPKYKFGASTMRNGFVNFQGGYASRGGSAYIGMCKQGAPNSGGTSTSNPPRDIPFQYSVGVGYVLEFGDQYMRPKYRGAYITEAAQNITAITQANPGVFTYDNSSYTLANNDWVYITGVVGMTEVNGLTWIVQKLSATTFTLTDLFGNALDTSTLLPYISSGTASRIYTAVSPYAAIDLPYLKFSQTPTQMSLTCYNQSTLTEYPPYDLQLISSTDWVFSQTTFTASIEAPTNVQATAQSSTTKNTWYSYVVTAVDSTTVGDESVASAAVYVQNNDISVNAGSNTITWNQVSNGGSYNIYAAQPYYSTSSTATVQVGVPYGYIGSALGNSFVDNNITPDYTTTPPLHNNPFARGAITFVQPTAGGSGLSQSTANYTISTTTGSGFTGTPIISTGGNLSGFLISNQGEGYGVSDTIVIVTGGSAASGQYTGTASNPSDGNTVILNSVTWTFKTAPVSPNQTKIQSNVNATFQQLASDLASSGNSLLTAANYSATSNVLSIAYAEIGTVGNNYTMAAGTYGGTPSGATLTGGTDGTTSSATASLTIGSETGTYPGTVGYFQQRRVYANTQNNPNTYYLSQPGNYSNMDSSIPSVSSDAIIGAPWAQQVNGIQFLTPMPGGLVIFTGAGLWQLSGGNTVALTPADQDAQPQSRYGCSSTIPPIPINFHILYVRENNGIVYDLVYNFFANIYTGNDLTVYSSHLFQGYTLSQWAYAEKPNKIIWSVRSDGTLLSLTYIAEQEEQGWARHDTNGLYVGITSIEEPPVDAVYTIVQRYVQGVWPYYAERFDNRLWTNVENCFCVDAGLSYPMTNPVATLTAASANGTNNITSTVVSFGGSGYTNPTATAVDASNTGSGATFTVTVAGGGITAVTPVLTGSKYVKGQTTIVITDSTGSGAVVQPVITNIVQFTSSAAAFNPIQYLYVANFADGTVSVLDPITNAVIETITVGAGPLDLTVTPDGTQVWVSNNDDATVSVIDTASLSVIATISGFSSPTTIVFTPDSATAYVLDNNDFNIYPVPVSTRVIGTGIGISDGDGMCILPDGTKIYVSNGSFNTIEVITVSSNTITATISTGNNLTAIAASVDSNYIYVADFNSASVYVISTSTNLVVSTIPVGNQPNGIAVAPSGAFIYILNKEDGSVSVVATPSNLVSATINIQNFLNNGIFTSVEGASVYVTLATDLVATISTLTNTITSYITVGSSPSAIGRSPTVTASSGVIGDVIRMGNGKAVITEYISTTQVNANILSPITAVLNNDPDNTPIPATSGNWSISRPTTTVTGLNHLEGKTVTGVADGGVITPQVVVGGAITLDQPSSAINVGLSFTAQLQGLYFETPSQNTVQTRRKTISSVGLRVHDSLGAAVGSNQPDASTQPGQVNVPWTNMIPVKERNQIITMGNPTPLQTKDYFQNIPSDWNIKGQVAVQQTNPLPLNVDAWVSYYTVGDTNEGGG